MKLYYDDPLIAAYMAEQFKVQYTKKISASMSQSSYHYESAVSYEITIEPGKGRKWDKRLSEYKTPFYIDPDSYYIFEPRNDDIITGITVIDGKEVEIIKNKHVDFYTKPGRDRITQRNGKAFFMPIKEQTNENTK